MQLLLMLMLLRNQVRETKLTSDVVRGPTFLNFWTIENWENERVLVCVWRCGCVYERERKRGLIIYNVIDAKK